MAKSVKKIIILLKILRTRLGILRTRLPNSVHDYQTPYTIGHTPYTITFAIFTIIAKSSYFTQFKINHKNKKPTDISGFQLYQ